ncbi:MAG: enoyl-CoA hydratase-related protein, partial [Syntrophales bacterium]|nr:enoyl-CoA hydratase-related protein [Syntrophales bacterium]
DKVVPAEDVLSEAKQIAAAILANGPLAVEAAKKAINQGIELGLEDGMLLEAALESDLFVTEDLQEGVGAFIEKRTPSFRRK